MLMVATTALGSMTLANMMWFGRFGPHPFWGYYGMHLGGLILWLLLLGLLVALLVALLRRRDAFTRSGASGGGHAPDAGAPPPSPLEVAKLRYARGELTREEFEALKRDLE